MKPIALAVAALVLIPAAAHAQGIANAGVRGVVTSDAGEPVAAVQLRLVNPATGTVLERATDRGGRYLFVGVAPGGPYTLHVTSVGYAEAIRDSLYLQGGSNLRLDIELASAATELEAIAVSVERDAVIAAARTGAATLLGERIVAVTPTLSRNAVELAALSPLVTLDDRTISIAGQSHRYNSLRIDGALNQDFFGLSRSGVPGGEAYAKPLPLEAVQQYQILVAPFDVRQSGFTGGIMNAVTRAGTNEWRGSVTGYIRDAVFGRDADTASAFPTNGGDFTSRLFGFTVGGPLAVDRTHVFAAAEFEWRERPVPGFSIGSADAYRVGFTPDSLQRIPSILGSQHGADAGEMGLYTLENPLANVFARIDHRIGERHRLVGRYSYAAATNDAPPNRAPAGAYGFESNGHEMSSDTHAASLQLVSQLGRGFTGELLLNMQRTADRTTPNGDFPEVDVFVASEVEGGYLARRARAGAASVAQQNELDQRVTQLSAAVSRAFGRHLLTAGVDIERFGVRHLFVPSAFGTYRYGSTFAFAANTPHTYERTVINEGYEPDVEFTLTQPALYLQDEWTAGERLTLTLGVRVDRPGMPANPERNEDLASQFPTYTHELPSGMLLFSPRFGFNWSRGESMRTQLRGGIGVFTGRPPLNWVANAYANTGLRSGLLVCSGPLAPALDVNAEAPDRCSDGSQPLDRQVVFFDRDLRFPQDWRGSIALDQELPGDFVVTIEGVYTRALNQIELHDVNIGDSLSLAPVFTDGYGDRRYYGRPVLPTGFEPQRVLDDYAQIIQVTNGERNSAFGASIELQRRFSERLDVRASYSYNGSYDTRSLGFPDATMNFGMTALRYDPNRPELTYSDYHRPHKFVAQLWSLVGRRWGGTEMTVLYIGQSGRPYSYVYEDDANGDGYPGPGALADATNDLLWVPRLPSDVPGGAFSGLYLHGLVELDPCLQRWMGRTMGRNVCYAPWSHRIDMRLTQGVEVAGTNVRLVADVMNVLNLLNDDWGLVQDVQSRVPVLDLSFREVVPIASPGEQFVTYVGPRARNPENGAVMPALPFAPATPESQWRAQLGVRVEF